MNLMDMICTCIFVMKLFGVITTPWWLVTILMIIPTVKWLEGK